MSATTESSPATLTVVGNPCANEGNFPAGMTRTDTIFSFERVGLQVGGAMLKRKRHGAELGSSSNVGHVGARPGSSSKRSTVDTKRYSVGLDGLGTASDRRSTTECLSTVPTVVPVKLQYDEYHPADGNTTRNPVVILHGLMYASIFYITYQRPMVSRGSKRNWLSLAKAFVKDAKRPIYTLVCVFVYRLRSL